MFIPPYDEESQKFYDRMQILNWAESCHRQTNHKYDADKPYQVHLLMVYRYGLKYINLIPDEAREDVLVSCGTHDLIEDARKTYNDVKKVCGERVAEITYALTNEKGRNRAERANAKYYFGILNTPYARFVKLCDRLANASYSHTNSSSMLGAYKKEYNSFNIYMGRTPNDEYEPMWLELDELLKD